MRNKSAIEAFLGTILVFNTVFVIPEGTKLFEQIFVVAVIFILLFAAVETIKDWEQQTKRKARRTGIQNGR